MDLAGSYETKCICVKKRFTPGHNNYVVRPNAQCTYCGGVGKLLTEKGKELIDFVIARLEVAIIMNVDTERAEALIKIRGDTGYTAEKVKELSNKLCPGCRGTGGAHLFDCNACQGTGVAAT